MFVGSLKKEVCTQIAKYIDFASWGKVFVGCSGSFRLEAVIAKYFAKVPVYSNF